MNLLIDVKFPILKKAPTAESKTQYIFIVLGDCSFIAKDQFCLREKDFFLESSLQTGYNKFYQLHYVHVSQVFSCVLSCKEYSSW